MFSYKEKVIIKYLRIKYKYGAARIVNDHPEHEWIVNHVKKLLKRIEKTIGVVQNKVSDTQTVCTKEKIKLAEKIFLAKKSS